MSAVVRVFNVLWSARTWGSILYLLAGLVLGVLWFAWSLTMYITGAALVIIWVGIPILVFAQLSMRWIGTVERRHINLLLGARIGKPEPVKQRPGAELVSNLWTKAVFWGGARFHDAHAWRVLAWTMFRGVMGPVGFVLAIIALVMPLAVFASAVFYMLWDFGALTIPWEEVPGGRPAWWCGWMYLAYPLSILLAVLLAWLMRGLTAAQVPLARWALGPCAAEREQALAARAELAEEQVRIDQELHDSIGHMITMTIVQAGAGAHVFDSDPEFARQALKNIEERGRSAMGELDRIIATIRGDEPETRAPLPGIGEIDALIASSRAAGIDVTADLDAPIVNAAYGRAAYGIVREALTNAARHAPGAPVEVVVARDGDALAIDVVNGPTPTPWAARGRTGGTGRGLSGIRDRVGLLGGRSSAGATAEGGFRVAVLLPLDASLAPKGDAASRWASLRARVGA